MSRTLIEAEKAHIWHPFTPMQQWCAADHEPLLLTRGAGCWLWDQHGNRYLDGNASIWTNIHGHQHPRINAAIAAQLAQLAHTSFLGFTHEPAIKLAQALVGLLPERTLTKVFYSDNGSTAIESAVRMALQYWKQNGHPERDGILAFDAAYHGDTLGAASLGGIPLFKGSANDFGYGVTRVVDMQALASLPATVVSRLAAVVIEPLIQGAAGMKLWPQGMLRELAAWCRERDIFLILDEVMTGFGRTGRMFACEHEGVVPDFLCLAKGLTGGYLPLAATLTTQRVFEGFLGDGRAFYYGHSYTANQLGCAAALASLDIFTEELVLEQLPGKVARLNALLEPLRAHPHVLSVRQCGLMAGIEVGQSREQRVAYPAAALVGAKICACARKHGLLTRPIVDTLVLMPPLCINDGELAQMVEAVQRSLEEICDR